MEVFLNCRRSHEFASDIKDIGCVSNPHDAFVANKMINNKQHTLTSHVDDVKSSHFSPKVNDDFSVWCEENCGSDDLGHAVSCRGKCHECVGMTTDCSKNKAALIETMEHVGQLEEDFPDKL